MKTRGDRLRHLRERAGFRSAREAAQHFDVPVSTYNAHERAGLPGGRDFDEEAARKYARWFGGNMLWLFHGKGGADAHIDSEAIAASLDDGRAEGSRDDPDGVSSEKIYKGKLPGASPDIDTSAGAGPGGLPLPALPPSGTGVVYAADAVRGEIVLPDYVLAEFSRAKAGRIHWIRVRGDSMEPTLNPGDRVAVDTTDAAIGPGGVFVIRDLDGEIMVKRLRKVPGSEPASIEIVSDNPKQGSDTVLAETVTVIGRVVARLARIG